MSENSREGMQSLEDRRAVTACVHQKWSKTAVLVVFLNNIVITVRTAAMSDRMRAEDDQQRVYQCSRGSTPPGQHHTLRQADQ